MSFGFRNRGIQFSIERAKHQCITSIKVLKCIIRNRISQAISKTMAQHPDISSVLRLLQIPTKVHSVYLVGSRLWGTHSAKSDFDLFIVVADPVSTSAFQKSQHKGRYDATLLTDTEFRAQVEKGSLIETICCLMPETEECVLLHDEEHSRRALIGKGHFHTMRIWMDERRQRDREKAMKFWSKGSEVREKGWKILQHAITAECILRGLQRVVDEEDIEPQDVNLTQETLRQLVASGREDGDRAWLGMEWRDVQVAHEERLERIKRTS
ncbi:hypothetical protein MSAN_01049900 [Mycena sanguinolenta]|uniref:Polymerase nucleotidyl transferase domain-containing protein n=1 Tax=Mycena sanguinolenta TaxID=230812 RepID=A0A8H6YMK8_9AGAR|nr:hypothetical protein MSAN_01049900 [Mycena sanguinolenta]